MFRVDRQKIGLFSKVLSHYVGVDSKNGGFVFKDSVA